MAETEELTLHQLSGPLYLNDLEAAKAYIVGKQPHDHDDPDLRKAGIKTYTYTKTKKNETDRLAEGARCEQEAPMANEDYVNVSNHMRNPANPGALAPEGKPNIKKRKTGGKPAEDGVDKNHPDFPRREALEKAHKSYNSLKITYDAITKHLSSIGSTVEKIKAKPWDTTKQTEWLKTEVNKVVVQNEKLLGAWTSGTNALKDLASKKIEAINKFAKTNEDLQTAVSSCHKLFSKDILSEFQK